MTVKSILDEKGRQVVTIRPDATITQAMRMLADKKIGALVVTDEAGHIKGIISERDIVARIAREGAAALDGAVAGVMTAKVRVCNENHTVNQVMDIMTRGRFRHLPVEKDGRLDGIVSIGDVVKRRIEDVEREADEIRNYIATA
jgi:CBS domain-containing protein